LGRYSEAIRPYLLGETGFPNGLALSVSVVEPEKAMISFSDPATGADRHSHFVYVPGILFCLMVDRAVTEEIRVSCFATNIHHPIVVMESVTGLFEYHLYQQYLNAPKSRKLIEAKKLRDGQRAASTSSSK
jgi:hypothetical protein